MGQFCSFQGDMAYFYVFVIDSLITLIHDYIRFLLSDLSVFDL